MRNQLFSLSWWNFCKASGKLLPAWPRCWSPWNGETHGNPRVFADQFHLPQAACLLRFQLQGLQGASGELADLRKLQTRSRPSHLLEILKEMQQPWHFRTWNPGDASLIFINIYQYCSLRSLESATSFGEFHSSTLNLCPAPSRISLVGPFTRAQGSWGWREILRDG